MGARKSSESQGFYRKSHRHGTPLERTKLPCRIVNTFDKMSNICDNLRVMDNSEEKREITKEEANKLAEQTIKENEKSLRMLEGELKEFGEFEQARDKFCGKLGITKEQLMESKNPTMSEGELDEDVQGFFDHVFKEMAADQAAKGGDLHAKKQRTGMRLSRRGKKI